MNEIFLYNFKNSLMKQYIIYAFICSFRIYLNAFSVSDTELGTKDTLGKSQRHGNISCNQGLCSNI